MILTINTGSSSIKISIYNQKSDNSDELFSKSYIINEINPSELILDIKNKFNITLVCHRVVFGEVANKNKLSGIPKIQPHKLNEAIYLNIKEGVKDAPLHNKNAIDWINIIKNNFDCENYIFFDSELFTHLPENSKIIPINQGYLKLLNIKKNGFHGLAHQQMRDYFAELKHQDNYKIITFQLGGGSSAAAFLNGYPIDTSMSYSPLDGLTMMTRPGSIDVGIILKILSHLIEQNIPADEIQTKLSNILNNQSGISAIFNRDILPDYTNAISPKLSEISKGADTLSKVIIDFFASQIKKYIGQYAAILGGVDAILFSGGISEHNPELIKKSLSNLDFLNIRTDNEHSIFNGSPLNIAREDSIPLLIVKCDENLLMKNQLLKFLKENPNG